MAKGDIFKSLPPAAKGIIAVVIVGGLAFIGYKIYKKMQADKSLVGSKAEIDTTKAEADKLASKPTTAATLTPGQLAILASSLFAAMDGYATDTSAIYKVFAQMNRDADVLGLVQAYGIRELSSGALNPEPNYKGALGGALTTELSNTELRALNTMLATKGIKYRF